MLPALRHPLRQYRIDSVNTRNRFGPKGPPECSRSASATGPRPENVLAPEGRQNPAIQIPFDGSLVNPPCHCQQSGNLLSCPNENDHRASGRFVPQGEGACRHARSNPQRSRRRCFDSPSPNIQGGPATPGSISHRPTERSQPHIDPGDGNGGHGTNAHRRGQAPWIGLADSLPTGTPGFNSRSFPLGFGRGNVRAIMTGLDCNFLVQIPLQRRRRQKLRSPGSSESASEHPGSR